MKKIIITSLILIMAWGASAQEETNLLTTRETSLTRQYLRPSLSKFYIYDGSSNSKIALTKLCSIENLKFDENTIDNNILVSDMDKWELISTSQDYIDNIITKEKLGNKIMKCWFPNFTKEEGYGIDVLMSRGHFAATDNDILKSNYSQRQSILTELGESLIDRSYVVFYIIADVSHTDRLTGKKVEEVNINAYLYKLDYNETIRNDFYNNYFMVENGIDKVNFPLKYVTQDGNSFNPNSDLRFYNKIMDDLTNKVADFQVKIPILTASPIRAKIGRKEGVRVDKRYALMEYRQDADGHEYSERIATVRAFTVANNYAVSTGDSKTSRFYYIHGKPAHEGMTLVENPDVGSFIEFQYNTAAIGMDIGFRLSRLLSIPGFFMYLHFGGANDEDGKLMSARAELKNKETNEIEWKNYPVFRIGGGFAQEFHVARNFVITPSFGAGVLGPIIITSKEKECDAHLDSYYIESALKIGYMVTRSCQLFAEGGYTKSVLGNQTKLMRDRYALYKGKVSKDPRKYRLGAGVKFYF